MQTLSHDPPLAHVTTFGGHPLSCAAGLAALEVRRRANGCRSAPRRWARAGASGWRRLIGAAAASTCAAAACCIGLEFADAAAHRGVLPGGFERGLILNWTLHRDTVVRLAPPLTISDADSERALTAIAAAVRDLA